jgi:signal transduction histidine kinase
MALRSIRLSYTWRVILIALTVAVVYYFSARAAFLFTYPGTRTLLFWPPSTVLLVAMLFTPRRTWWTFIVATLPAHLLPVTPMSASALYGVLFYAGNVIESMVIALAVLRFNGGRPRFDNFISTVVFILVAFLAPAIGSVFVAAAASMLGVPPGFSGIWQARTLSYVVSMLMLVPPALMVLESRGAVLRKAPVERYVEAGVIVLCYIGLVSFVGLVRPPQLLTVPALLLLPLPLLLWAGARFGVAGVSLNLMIVAIITLWSASFNRELFGRATPDDYIQGVKIVLIELGVPLVLMAALLAERRNTIRWLQASNRQVRQLAGQLITAQEEERRRVARELHDQVGQSLTTVKINLDTLRMGQHHSDTRELLDEGSRLVDGALEQVRDLSVLLRPAMLDDLGLEPALRALLNAQSKRAGYQATFQAEGLNPRLSREVETICYRIVQEALTNVARHAQAQQVQLHVAVRDGRLVMTLHDDGVGFDVQAKQAGAALGESTGLLSMTERARMGGGELQMTAAPGKGTTLRLNLPLQPLA